MSDSGSLVFYVISFIISTVFYGLYIKFHKKFFLVISFLIPLLIGGLRYMVGTDYAMYVNNWKSSIGPPESLEIGYWSVKAITRSLGSYQIMFFIFNFLTLLFFYLGLKNIKKEARPLALLCFFFLYFTSSFNIMRQMLAVSIFFFSLKYLKEKKIIKYYLFSMLAVSFHSSAVLMLLVYPFFTSKRKIIKVLCVIGTIIITLVLENIIGLLGEIAIFEHFSMYDGQSATSLYNNYSFYIELILFVYILMKRKKLLMYDDNNNKWILIYLLGVILTFSGFASPFIKRIALYFCVPSVLLLGEVPKTIKEPKSRLLNYVGIIMFVILKFIIGAYVLGQADIIPYNWIGGIV